MNELVYECCNDACPWRGPFSETVHPKHHPDRLLCPECYEVVEPALPPTGREPTTDR